MNVRTLIRCTLVGLALATALAGSANAHRASYGNLRTIAKGDDQFRNYDFKCGDEQLKCVRADNVDWAIDFLFTNNAEVDKVKGGIAYCCFGDPMYGRLYGGPETSWKFVFDGDRGSKDSWCPIGDGYHMRLYADGDDRLYNTSWGYWIFGSAHIDHAECGGDAPWSGMNETAENIFSGRAASAWGSYRVFKNNYWLANAEPLRFDGGDYWWNSGYATRVIVP